MSNSFLYFKEISNDFIEMLVTKYMNSPSGVVGVLSELQEANFQKCLNEALLEKVGSLMNIPLAQLYSIVTYNPVFNLSPQGKHTLVVCRGTACHTYGSLGVLRALCTELELSNYPDWGVNSLTTADGQVTVQIVPCLGLCALSPAVVFDGQVHGPLTEHEAIILLRKFKKEISNGDA